MKRFKKVYLEITNVCNLNCDFCKGTNRPPMFMEEQNFLKILSKLEGYTDYIYFHLLGEPLLHPNLESFLKLAAQKGYKVTITTNGTLLDKRKDILFGAEHLYKTVISLHSFEANDLKISFEDYLKNCCLYSKQAKGIVVYRLWNKGGKDKNNGKIFECLKEHFKLPFQETRDGYKLADKVYLQYGDKFKWPDIDLKEENDSLFCYGLRDQMGVLCDGTVVPCCLDSDGNIPLGNILNEDLEKIINSKRAIDLYNGFTNKKAVEPLCKKCGYAQRFK